jgi:hypothetical protein
MFGFKSNAAQRLDRSIVGACNSVAGVERIRMACGNRRQGLERIVVGSVFL